MVICKVRNRHYRNQFHRAALVARRPKNHASLRLPPDEARVFRLEVNASFWDETYIRVPIPMCCIAGVVQGWTQSSANAANLYYPKALGMTDDNCAFTDNPQQWLFNAQNAALFLSGALAGCFLSDPLNEWLNGRRGAILIAAIFTFISVIGTAFWQTKWELLIFRIIVGLGMGAKASVGTFVMH
jgi:MFS family permease